MRLSALAVVGLIVIVVLSAGFAVAEDPEAPGAWLGVKVRGVSGGEGVQIARILNDSPADDAGLRGQDVVLDFDGVPVTGSRDLIERIKSLQPGGWVKLRVLRGDDEKHVDVKLGERPAVIRNADFRRGWIGVEAIALPGSLREHFGAPPDAGVMISEVEPGSPAEAAGFELGDVVFEVDEQAVKSPRALKEMIASGGVDNEREFVVARDGAEIVLEAILAAAPVDPEKQGKR